MVVAAFPVAKLGALLIKQVSKPIANAVKSKAVSSPVFRKYVCLPPAQFYNWCEKKSKMWLLNMGQPVNITILNEAASIELGANLVGEGVIFIIAAGILVVEYNRSAKKEAAKEAARRAEMANLNNALRDLFIQTEEQGTHIRELTRKVGDLETQIVRKPWTPPKKPPEEPPSGDPPVFSPHLPNSEEHDQHFSEDVNLIEHCKYKPLKGVIFKALSHVENDFLVKPAWKREEGIITVALNQLYKDVYRTPLTF